MSKDPNKQKQSTMDNENDSDTDVEVENFDNGKEEHNDIYGFSEDCNLRFSKIRFLCSIFITHK